MKIRALIAVAALAITSLHAQQEGAAKPAAKPDARTTAYRFEYTLTELSGKQRINARKFEILASDRGSVRTGSRIAVPTGSGTQFQYFDVGLNANMHFVVTGDGVIHLDVEVSETFLIAPEAASEANRPPAGTRDVKMQIATEVKPGVPTVLGIVEDVASTHSFELSVTATPR